MCTVGGGGEAGREGVVLCDGFCFCGVWCCVGWIERHSGGARAWGAAEEILAVQCFSNWYFFGSSVRKHGRETATPHITYRFLACAWEEGGKSRSSRTKNHKHRAV